MDKDRPSGRDEGRPQRAKARPQRSQTDPSTGSQRPTSPGSAHHTHRSATNEQSGSRYPWTKTSTDDQDPSLDSEAPPDSCFLDEKAFGSAPVIGASQGPVIIKGRVSPWSALQLFEFRNPFDLVNYMRDIGNPSSAWTVRVDSDSGAREWTTKGILTTKDGEVTFEFERVDTVQPRRQSGNDAQESTKYQRDVAISWVDKSTSPPTRGDVQLHRSRESTHRGEKKDLSYFDALSSRIQAPGRKMLTESYERNF